MDKLHEVYVVERETSSRVCFGVRLTKIQATTRPDYLWPEIWIGMSKAAKKKEKKNGLWKTKLDMLCKMETRKRAWKLRETVASENTNLRKKTKYACNVEPHESTRKRLESTLPRNHEDHIAEQGFNSVHHHNLVHKFIPMPQAMKIPDAKSAVDKTLGKVRENASLAVGKHEEQERCYPGSTKK